MKAKALVLICLSLVCVVRASAQRDMLPVSDTVNVNSSSVTKNEQLAQGFRFSGAISGTGFPDDVSLVSQTSSEPFDATFTGTNTFEVVAPADTYNVIVTFDVDNDDVGLTYLESTVVLTADTKHNITLVPVTLNTVTGSVSGLNVGSFDSSLSVDSKSISGFMEVSGAATVIGGSYSLTLPAGSYAFSVDQNFASTNASSSVTESLGTRSVASGPNTINLTAASFTTVTLSGNISFTGSASVPANTNLFATATNPVAPLTAIVGVVGSVPQSGAYSFVVPSGEAYSISPEVDDAIIGSSNPQGLYQPTAFQTSVISANTSVSPNFPAIPGPETPATLQGTLTGPSGRPLRFCFVELDSTSLTQAANTSFSRFLMTDAVGHYSAQFPMGSYDLFAFCSFATSGDMDGDGKADMSIFRSSNGTFYDRDTDPTIVVQQWGTNGDVPVRGDFDGDGVTDIGVFRPSSGQWFVIPSSNPGTPTVQSWGANGDVPVPGDYDGDGITDFAVFRPSTGQWFIIPSSNPGTPIVKSWGISTDIPAPGDYDGDGSTDVAVFRPSNGVWYIIPSSHPGTPTVQAWGTNGDKPVPGDYDGDGKTDIAVFRPTNGVWYVIPSKTPGTPIIQAWGISGDVPVPADYDGDQKTDIGVWRPSNGIWYVLPSSAPGTSTGTAWGVNGDTPLQRPIGQ